MSRRIDYPTDGLCPVCTYPRPRGWLLCEGCSFETPSALHNEWQCASHFAHNRRDKQNKHAPAEIARCNENERIAALKIISHLRQHGSALAAA